MKKICCSHKNFKQALNNGLVLKRVHRVIEFNQKAWLKPYIEMNTKLRKEAKNEFEKDFFKLMNNAVFGKAMENVRMQRGIKLVTTDEKRDKLASEPNYHTTKYSSKNLLAKEMKKAKVKMNKSVYLGMSILDIRKTLCMNFGMITLNQNMETEQKDVLGGKIMKEFCALSAKTYAYLTDDDSENKKS